MSNIQITENASGKYSPEWFYSESQTPEWISFAHKADELRENFINLFGIERLKSLSGKDLLTSLFYNDEGTKTNLCYILEMDKDIREVFGSISGGAAYKFGLFYHKKNQSWTCGSPLKPVLLTEAEAIQKADEMRNDLVEGAEIISSFGPLDSEEDYEQLYKQLEHIPGINMVWRMKYYQMLFPALFAPFYGQDIQLRVLHFLNQKPSDIPFIRMGQISLYARKCNVPGVVFAHIYGKNVGYTNETNDSDTNTLSDKKHKTHYWMYTVFDDKSWNECQQKGIMVLGILLSTPHKRACFFRESAFEVYRRTCHRQPLLYTLVLKKDQKSSSSLFLPFILFSLSHNPLSYVHFPLNSPKAAFLCPLQARPPLPINQLLPNTTPIQSHQQQQTPARYRPSSSFSP